MIITNIVIMLLRIYNLRRRVFNLNHDEICDEFLTENHAIMMYEPMLPQEGYR